MTSLITFASKAPALRKGPKPFKDIEKLKATPILKVAEALGMKLLTAGPGTWAERDPKAGGAPTSLTLFEKTNSWVRFSGKEQGGCSKGSVIDLVRHVKDCDSVREACDFLKRLS